MVEPAPRDAASLRAVVWGTGNVGRPAIRAVAAHRDLTLAGVLVHSEDKVGTDAGSLAFIDDLGIGAISDGMAVDLDPTEVDAVVYAVNADFRPEASLAEVEALLRAGINVVTPAFYPMYHPPSMPAEMAERFSSACSEGNASIFASGIDPGWIMDMLPLLATGVSANVTQIRCREIFNYALYDQPDAVRGLIGFGQPLDANPPMLLDFSLQMVWGPMIRVLADGLGLHLDGILTAVDKRPLDATINVPGMGDFEAGTMGAFHFTVTGMCGGQPLLVIEHITRIDDACAPDWPYPPTGQGVHEVQIVGNPDMTISVHGDESGEPGAAGGGNAMAANRLVNAIPTVCAAGAGVLHPLDVGLQPAPGQMHLRSTH